MNSINPITGKKYNLPAVLDDRKNIDSFLSRNNDKKVVVVQGLGFVGAVMSLVVANALTEEYAVIGIDLPNENNYWKIASINDGHFPVTSSDPKIEIFFQEARKTKNLLATYDPYCYNMADVVIVDINLDVDKKSNAQKELLSYHVDLSAFKKAIETIGTHTKEEVLVLVETTVPPGTCQKIVKPILDDCFAKRGLSPNYKLGHSYERVMPGPNYVDSIQNFYRVFSGIDDPSKIATEEFLKTIVRTDRYPLTCLANTTASEMAKVLENSFRAMNIAFIDEWTAFAEEAGVNLFEVVQTIRKRPTHKNIMLPGLGVGGYCLTKDPLMANWARQNLFNSKEALVQSEQAVRINDRMPSHSFEIIKKHFGQDLNRKNALFLGVSYLSNVGDTRYTPVELLFDQLSGENCNITIHDPHVRYWVERNLHINPSLRDSFEQQLDLIVFCTGHNEYRDSEELLAKIMSQNKLFILDSQAVLKQQQIEIIQTKHIFKVVGRGDI